MDPFLIALVVLLVGSSSSSLSPAASYSNYTVGGSSGWFYSNAFNKSVTDYQAWAQPLTFNLGDYLMFNTTTNHTVILSYNKTTYDTCDYSDSGDDTNVYSSPSVNQDIPDLAEIIEVPLLQTGSNYFFSSADEPIQCLNGMKFSIVVNKGEGLPPSLNQPPPPPPIAPAPPPVTVPDTKSAKGSGADAGPVAGALVMAAAAMMAGLFLLVL